MTPTGPVETGAGQGREPASDDTAEVAEAAVSEPLTFLWLD